MKSTKDGISGVRESLSKGGGRWTKPRERVLDVFIKSSAPLSPAEVYRRLASGKINLASVYRTLQLFCRMGVLVSVDRVEDGQRYELSDDYRAHHHHLVCRDCGRVEDFDDCFVKRFEKRILKTSRFQVTRHELQFFGVCRSCQ